jgi:hypothetical protein
VFGLVDLSHPALTQAVENAVLPKHQSFTESRLKLLGLVFGEPLALDESAQVRWNILVGIFGFKLGKLIRREKAAGAE